MNASPMGKMVRKVRILATAPIEISMSRIMNASQDKRHKAFLIISKVSALWAS